LKTADWTFNRKTLALWLSALLVFVVVLALWGFGLAVAFGLFALAFLLDIDPAIGFGVALVLLVTCAFMTLLGQQEAAKAVAMWSYCFLAVGVALQFYHYLKAGPTGDGGSEE
jgi:hypothetical protein